MGHIFISYSRKDEPFARRLADRLGSAAWIDVKDIPVGVDWSDAIQAALTTCQVMILIITPDSMDSKTVNAEWKYFLDHNKFLIPVLLKPANLHFRLNSLQYIDFYHQDFERAFAYLDKVLRQHAISHPPVASPVPRHHRMNRIYWAGGCIAIGGMVVLVGLLVLLIQGMDGETGRTSATQTAVALEDDTATEDPMQFVQPTPTPTVQPTYTLIPTQPVISPPVNTANTRMASVSDIEQILPSSVELSLPSTLSINPDLSKTYSLDGLVNLLRSLGVNGLADATLQAGQRNGYVAQISRVWDTRDCPTSAEVEFQVVIMLFNQAEGARNHLRDEGIQQEQINTGLFSSFEMVGDGILAAGTIPDSRCGTLNIHTRIVPHGRFLVATLIKSQTSADRQSILSRIDQTNAYMMQKVDQAGLQ